MNPVVKTGARNVGVIIGAIFGAFVGYQTYKYKTFMVHIEKSTEEMNRKQAELLAWPHNAPQEVQDVLFGRK